MSDDIQTERAFCQVCGAEVDSVRLAGSCQRCLLKDALSGNGGTIETGEAGEVGGTTKVMEGSGVMIGRYKPLQKIGEGGFGVVYLGEQQEPVIRKVALKVIKLGMDTDQVIARFEAERQALAMMEHPNIARVLDAGMTETGRPFFVMELVKGIPITKFCDEKRLPIKDWLQLFVEVCGAVQHAHQKGIIHRDLKPTNILIMLHEGNRPVPKVIDFGIAKATQHRLTEKTLLTEFHQMVGTPAYMSPEQAHFSGLDIDTRSDVYSLGVLLYEMLTGQTTFSPKDLLGNGYEEICRYIREVEPPAPSKRWSSLPYAEQSTKAKIRQSDPAQVGRFLRGELDWIVMKAMEKDRRRRYDTASGLALDVKRFLNDEPVFAVAPSILYQFKKFARRHKATFAAGTAITASLILGLGLAVYSWAGERAARAESELRGQETDEQRQRAEAHALQARRLQYAADLRLAQVALDASDPAQAKRLLRGHIPSKGEEDLRGWEWRYLWSQIPADPQVTARDSVSPSHSLSVSADGAYVAVGRLSGAAEILDADTLKRVRTVQQAGESEERACVAFVPHTGLLAISGWRPDSNDPETRLWDLNAGRFVRTFTHPHTNFYIYAVASSPDGKWLATLAKGGALQVHSVETGKLKQEFAGLKRQEDFLEFAADSRRLAALKVINEVDHVVIFDLDTDDELEVEAPNVKGFAFSRDGSVLAVSHSEGITLRDGITGKFLKELEGDVGARMLFRDGAKTLVAKAGPSISIRDLTFGAPTRTLKGLNDIRMLAAVGETDHVITTAGDGSVSRWSLSAPPPADRLTIVPEVQQVVTASGPDGKMIARMVDGAVAISDWKHPNQLQLLGALGHENDKFMSWCPEKQILAAYDTGNRIKVWAATGEIVASPQHRPNAWPRSMAFVQNGELFVTLDKDDELVAWDTGTWERADDRIPLWKAIFNDFLSERGSRGRPNGFTISSDERLLAIWARQGYVTWYDLTDGSRLADEACHPLWLADFAFSADGKTAASVCYSQVVLWRTESIEIIDTIQPCEWRVALSPKGTRLLTIHDRNVQIWDVVTRRHLARIDYSGGIGKMGFTPDGNGFFIVGTEGLHVWNPPSLAEIDEVEADEK